MLAAPVTSWTVVSRGERDAATEVLVPLILIAVVVGLFIGAVGVGGVALPPFLTWFLGFDPHLAAGTSSWSFLFTGVVGTLMYARGGAIRWHLVGSLTLGAAPAAFLGSQVNGMVPAQYALLPLAVLVAAAGIYNLTSTRRAAVRPDRGTRPVRATLSTRAAASVGAVVGFASALTGTGGPVFLIPILLAIGVPVLTAIAAAQVIQIPLVLFAVAGFASQGAVDFGAGTAIGLIAGVGVVIGASIAMRLPSATLHRVAGYCLVGFGTLLLAVTFLGLS